MSRSSLILLACVSLTAVACGGEPETSVQETTGFEQVEPATGSEQVEQTTSSDECPPNWPGPWTACPEADWVEQVAHRAEYRISGETGSALIAKGSGRSFYIWATEGTPEQIETAAKSWKLLGVVEGVQIYGDESVWRWWVAKGFTIWLQAGPTKDSRIPSLSEMESLVRASKTVPRPH